MTRANPFGDLSEFTPGQPAKRVESTTIEQLALANDFPSRQPAAAPPTPQRLQRRRYVTGRNRQINLKATPQTVARLYQLADERNVPLGELLELALDALTEISLRLPK